MSGKRWMVGLLLCGGVVGGALYWLRVPGGLGLGGGGDSSLPVAVKFGKVELAAVLTASEADRYGWKLDGDFQVTPEGRILLQSGGSIWNVLDGKPILTKPRDDLSGFCTVGEGLVAVCGSFLCSYDPERGELESAVQLPSDRVRIAGAGDDQSLYLYDTKDGQGDIYQFTAGGSVTKLVHTERPVLAVTGTGGRLFFSVRDRVMTWRPGEEMTAIVDMGKALGSPSAPITSLTIDPKTGVLFFACGEGVYALSGGNAILLLAGATGDLQFAQNRLFIKDRVQRAILEVQGAVEAVTPAVTPAT